MSFKCTEEAKTHIPEEMRLELEAVAHELGCSFAEMLRDYIYLARRGETFGEHVANHRRAVLGGQGQTRGHARPNGLPTVST